MKLRSLFLCLFFVACAKREGPLPGDSVALDGAVTLSPPHVMPAQTEAPLGAIESKLFPPELVMEHQAALDIQPTERDAITKEIDHDQAEILRLQWDLQGEKEKLVAVLDSDHVDETKAKEAAARVMNLENQVKGANLSMLVRVKNLLTPEQQKKLRALR